MPDVLVELLVLAQLLFSLKLLPFPATWALARCARPRGRLNGLGGCWWRAEKTIRAVKTCFNECSWWLGLVEDDAISRFVKLFLRWPLFYKQHFKVSFSYSTIWIVQYSIHILVILPLMGHPQPHPYTHNIVFKRECRRGDSNPRPLE